MSKVSPARYDPQVGAFVDVGAPCAICGAPVEEGGHWSGASALYLCGRGCAEKLILLALDAIADTEPPRPDSVRFEDWITWAGDTFERWAEAERRRAS